MSGALKFKDFPFPLVRLACQKCDRAGQYRTGRLRAEYSDDIALPDLLLKLAVGCPKVGAPGNDPCGVYFVDLARKQP